MYSVSATVEGVTQWLHDDTVSNSSVKLIEPVLTMEDSSAGSFTFKLAPNNIGYEKISVEKQLVDSIDSEGNVTMRTVTTSIDLVARMQSTIKVYRNGVEIWEGRVLSEDRDFQNLRNIYCEGELAYLNDVCLPQRRYDSVTRRQFLEAIISCYNSRCDASRRFTVGVVTVHGGATTEIASRIMNYEKALDAVNKLVEEFGGHIRVRKENGVRYIDWLAEYPNTSTQTIKFGSNLLDFTCNWDMSELCTVVLPTGEVVQEANNTTIGEPIEPTVGPTQGRMMYLNETTHDIAVKQAANLGGYRVATYNFDPPIPLGGKNYYISCRLHGGLVGYVAKDAVGGIDGSGNTLEYKTLGTSDKIGFTDMIDEKILLPSGTRSISICGWSTDVPISVKPEIPATEDYDKYLTIEKCPTDVDATTGASWHQYGSPYICNPELVTKYGWIERQIQYPKVSTKEELYSSAKAYLQYGQFDKMTIEVSAIDLHLLNVNAEAINLLDMVWVESEPHGLSQAFPVTKLEIPLDRPEDQKFTIGGQPTQSLTSVNNKLDEALLARIAGIPNMSQTLESAKQNAANLIAMATNGFITTVMDAQGNPKELVISNTKDPTQCTSCWVWNVNGLGHFDHYPLQTGESGTNLALTMDGQIVADRITTGTLAAIDIRGCDAYFGGLDNRNGKLVVRANEAGKNYCVALLSGGINFGYVDASDNVTSHSTIWSNKKYQVGSDWLDGVAVDAPVLAFDVDHLWMDPKDGQGARGGYTGTLDFEDAQGNRHILYFINGICTVQN